MPFVRFNASFTPEFLALIDDWRATQRPIPGQSAAIMQLAEAAIPLMPLFAAGRSNIQLQIAISDSDLQLAADGAAEEHHNDRQD